MHLILFGELRALLVEQLTREQIEFLSESSFVLLRRLLLFAQAGPEGGRLLFRALARLGQTLDFRARLVAFDLDLRQALQSAGLPGVVAGEFQHGFALLVQFALRSFVLRTQPTQRQ